MMATAPLRYCLQQGCSEKCLGGYCPSHSRQASDYRHRYTKGNYGRPHRRRIEAFRQKYPERVFCEDCLKVGDYIPVEEYDHIIPHRGDTDLRDDINNLQPLCKRHHSAKTATENMLGHTR